MNFYVMNSKDYNNWMTYYDSVMNDPNSSDDLLQMVEDFDSRIVIED